MKSLYDVPAPAKLNLFLHITGRRADGYHLLQSVFALLDWSDTLHFEVRTDGVISREDLSYTLPADDLVTRAARALQQSTKCSLGANIGIFKRIPSQAGMGGGSSDAASTLLTLNRMWSLNLSIERLSAIGLSLGADVPFFLCGNNAWVEGLGERLTPIKLPVQQYLVVKPDAGLDTRMIFSDPDLKRDSEPAIISGFATNAFDKVFEYGQNDLQTVAQKLCPDVTIALDWLQAQGLSGRMTGSGSAVFALLPASSKNNSFRDFPEALANVQVRVCRGLDVHPLFGWADSDGTMSV